MLNYLFQSLPARFSHRDSGFRDKLARQVGRSAAEAQPYSYGSRVIGQDAKPDWSENQIGQTVILCLRSYYADHLSIRALLESTDLPGEKCGPGSQILMLKNCSLMHMFNLFFYYPSFSLYLNKKNDSEVLNCNYHLFIHGRFLYCLRRRDIRYEFIQRCGARR